MGWLGPQQAREQPGRRRRRQWRHERAQVLPARPDRSLERGTPCAVIEVRANAPAAPPAPVAIADRPQHLLAVHRAAVLAVEQRAPRLEDRLFGSVYRHAKRARDLLVREAAQLAHHQGAALTLRQDA